MVVRKPKRHIQPNQDRIYTCTVAGDYYARTETDRNTIKRYTVTVKLSEAEMDAALSIIVRNLLPTALATKYPDAIRYRTHTLMEVVCDDDPTTDANDPNFMSKPELLTYITEYGLPVKAHLYPELAELQQAVNRCVRDEDAFVTEQTFFEERHGHELQLKTKLQDLNPTLNYQLVV